MFVMKNVWFVDSCSSIRGHLLLHNYQYLIRQRRITTRSANLEKTTMLFNTLLAGAALFAAQVHGVPTLAKRGEGIHLVNCYGPGKTFSGVAVSLPFVPPNLIRAR